ncbi:MAG: M60 family metallopeptidase [Bacteroidaceae bacterium]|nr:M60 family metallopeptidase [Bacteroidaceae bacterium]
MKPLHYLLALLFFLAPSLTRAADESIAIRNAVATSSQSGEEIKRAYDGNTSTLWHSSYNSTTFPVNVTFLLKEASHVDYIKYTPRSNGTNGNFQEVTVYVSEDASVAYSRVTTEVTTVNLGGVGSVSYIYLGDQGIDNVQSIRLCIKSGSGGWASAAEIEFFKADRSKEESLKECFSDALCTQLKPEVTSADGIEDETVKTLVQNLLTDADSYKKYRVGEFEPYQTLATLKKRLKINHQYCSYENPTGIYFSAGETIYVMAEGIPVESSVSLIVKNFGKANDSETQDQSNFTLRNGLNTITPEHRGNSYVSYYDDNFESLPNVKLHFINATVNGYFDLQRGDTNDDWKALLKNATSDILDIRTQRLQVAFPLSVFKSKCPNNGVELAQAYDEIVRREREVMGLLYFNSEPKNRQFFRVVHSGFMFADNIGAAVHLNSVGACINGDPSSLDFWGMAHELGHNNQLTRSFHWSGCGETTNNIYSAWVQYNLGNKNNLRLEDEVTGINDYSGTRGGRFQAYLEEGVRKGIYWQLQDGPDYHGSEFTTKSVTDEDYNGKKLSKSVTVQTRNYDHFLKVTPLWQLQLYTHLVGRSPNMYGKVMEAMRKANDSGYSNGQLQMQFMRLVCDSTQLNFLPFFEKAGMLQPISAYIEDYGAGWIKISNEMIADLKAHVQEMGYADITEEVNYITAHNWKIYADKLALQGTTLGSGCTPTGNFVKVEHSKWKNAVAFETYDSQDSLIRITMYGLGSDDAHSYTKVLYPSAEDAAYIMAVGYDGTRIRCYEAKSERFIPGNKLYRITAVGRSKVLSTANVTADADGNITSTTLNKVATAASSAADISQLWQFQSTDDGTFYLVNPNTGLALGGSAGQKASMMTASEAGTYSLENYEDNIWVFNNKKNGQYLNAFNGSSSSDVGYWSGGSGDSNNRWKIDEVEAINFVIGSYKWNPLCLPFAVSLPDGLTAYIATSTGKNSEGTDVLVLTPIGTTIPANTPVLINGSQKTHKLTILPDESSAAPESNLLRGTLAKRTGVEKNSVALFSNNTTFGVGLYLSSNSIITANKVYLAVEDLPELTTPGNGLVLTTLETSISSLPAPESLGSTPFPYLYNLQGQKITTPTPGIYITPAGRKVLIK